MINFNKEMYPGRSHLLSPLTRLTSKSVPFKWTDIEQKAFEEAKKRLCKDTQLTYPDFNKPFDVHTDASDKQLGAVISQDGKPIAHFSRTLNSAQKNYTVTDKETLSIVELLKEYRGMLYGHKIRVYTDHKNLTHSNTQSVSQRIMRWRLLMEEFGIDLIYIKGEHNVAADALSRLPRRDVDNSELENSVIEFIENYEICEDEFPLDYQLISRAQARDKEIQHMLNTAIPGQPSFKLSPFVGGGKTVHLITNTKEQIIIPSELITKIVGWYHDRQVHPGRDRLYEGIYQHFDCPKAGQLRNAVSEYVRTCDACQKSKKASRHYGQVPAKQIETKPWEVLHIDLYGPKKIPRADGTVMEFKVMTMIDPVTGWFEMGSYDDATPETIMNILEISWLNRYPRPLVIVADRGGEFTGHFFRNALREEYGIELRLITTANPQANAVVERIHQVIGNMLRTMDVANCYLLPPPYDPWAGLISAIAFAIRSTWNSSMRATPGQLVFGRDMMLNIRHLVDWHYMQTRRQKIASENNARENAKRVPHNYEVGDLVLKAKGNPGDKSAVRPTLQRPFEGPYRVHHVWNNGTVTIRRTVRGGAIFERINIRRIRPYHNR
jgi:transposase InsO family protein